MNAVRQISRRFGRTTGARARSAADYSITATLSVVPDPLKLRVVSRPLRGLEGLVRRKDGVASLVLTVDILGRALETSVLQSDLVKMK